MNTTPAWQAYLRGLHEGGVIRGYQASWLSAALNGTKFAALGARQIGKGWTVALVAITLAHGYVTASGEYVPPHDVLVLSKDQRTSKNMISMIRKHLDLCEQMFGGITSTRMGGLSEIYLEGKGKIVSMPGSPRSIQGFTGSVIIDELAANRWDPEELVAQGLSVTSSKDYFRFMLISNAGISGGFAHQFFEGDGEWEKRRKDFACFSTTIYDAYPDGLPERLKSLKRTISPKMWARFFENSFEGAGVGILDRIQIGVVSSGKYIRCVMGIDPGFSDNPTGVVIAGVDSRGGIVILYSDWWFNVGIDEQATRIRGLISFWKPAKTIIDRGMAGFALAAKFERDNSVEFIGVNGPGKQKMLAAAIDLIESGRVGILESQPSGLRKLEGSPEIFWNDIETLQWTDNGALDIGTTIVRSGTEMALQRGAKLGTKIHADTAMAFAYCAEWLAGNRVGSQAGKGVSVISGR